MSYPPITLQSGKEMNALHRHPWIFSGALTKRPSEDEVTHGALIRLTDVVGKVVGIGTYSAKSSIAVRLLSFGPADVVIDAKWFAARLKEAEERRALLGYGQGTPTDGYRVVFGEADGIPGLVVDRYRNVFVIQISTAGMDNLRAEIVAAIKEVFSPECIYERSDINVRKEEGLKEQVGLLDGELPEVVAFNENGLNFVADVVNGQKTGFFLDQKALRSRIAAYSKGRKALNLFSYTGTAGIAAVKGGAEKVINVDSSKEALAASLANAEMNDVTPEVFVIEEADVFQYLSNRKEAGFGMVLLDPPALIKAQRDSDDGKKAYHFLNRAVLRLIEDGGILVTSSCSHFLNEEDFAFILRRASVQAGVRLDVLEVVRQSTDHPLSVYFPESAYLTSFICRVSRTNVGPTWA